MSVVLEAEPEDEPQDEDEAPLARPSFFAEDDDAACAAVWALFVKASNAAGFDARSASSKASTEALRRRCLPQRETTMATKTEDKVLTAYRNLKAKLGRVPGNLELADALGITGANDTARAVAAGKLRGPLIAKGLAESGPRGGARKAHAPPAPPVRTPDATPATRASRDPIVAALIEKRDELIAKAKALDVAIEALS